MRLRCWRCGERFTPVKGGHNARYCSSLCKRRAQRYRDGYDPIKRAGSYERTKACPEKYAAHLASGRAGRAASRNWLADFKLEQGCVDCGYNEHRAALQLDHEGEKSVSIADARSSLSRLKKEIAKGQCVVRCAICHSLRTWERKQHGITNKDVLRMGVGKGLHRARLDVALVGLTWAVSDLAETIAGFGHAEVTSVSPELHGEPSDGLQDTP